MIEPRMPAGLWTGSRRRATEQGDRLRILVEVSRTEHGFEGVVSAEGSDVVTPFSGWLEFMALVDAVWRLRNEERGET
jgi:hypothetical protein